MSQRVFLFEIKCVPHDLQTITAASQADSSCAEGLRAQRTKNNCCATLLFGRTQANESVCVRVDEFTPSLRFRLPLGPQELEPDTIMQQLLDLDTTNPRRYDLYVDKLEKNELYVSVNTFQAYTTKEYVIDKDDPRKRQSFQYMEFEFASLLCYKHLHRLAVTALHHKPLPCEAIPVELKQTPEQQFLHACAIQPSAWFQCLDGYSVVHPMEQISTCTHEWSITSHVDLSACPEETSLPPQMRLMSYDIEVRGHENVFPKASDDYCIVASIACTIAWSGDDLSSGNTRENTHFYHCMGSAFTDPNDPEATWVAVDTEEELLQVLRLHARQHDVDVILSYNGRAFDLPYIRQRQNRIVGCPMQQHEHEDGDADIRREYMMQMASVVSMGRIPGLADGIRYTKIDRSQQSQQDAVDAVDEDDGADEDAEMGGDGGEDGFGGEADGGPSSRTKKRSFKQAQFKPTSSSSGGNGGNDGSGDTHSLVLSVEGLEERDEESATMALESPIVTQLDSRIEEPCVAQAHGVVDFDLCAYLLAGFQNFDSYKLGDVGREVVGQQKEDLSPNELFRILANPTMEGMQLVKTYNGVDTLLVLKIVHKQGLIPFLIRLGNITHTCVSELLACGQQHRLTQFVMHKARLNGFVMEQMGMREYKEYAHMVGPYEGATVLPTVPCYVHKTDEFVVVNDYNSLYPSIMKSMNLSHEQFINIVDPEYVVPPELADRVLQVEIREIQDPLIVHHYRVIQALPEDEESMGLISRIETELLTERKACKQRMKTHAKDSDEYFNLDVTQNVLKVVANSLYGSLGAINQFGALSHRPLARLVTYFGRMLIEIARDAFMTFPNTSTVAGDTDSVMIKVTQSTLKEAIDLGNAAAVKINEELQRRKMRFCKIAFEKAMQPAIFLRQKMYAYMKYEDVGDLGQETSMGLMSKKRGTAKIFKDAYTKMIKASLLDPKDVSTEQVQHIVLRILRELFFVLGQVSVDEFARTQSIKGSRAAYKTLSASAYAMMKLQQDKGTPWFTENTRMSLVMEYTSDPKAKVNTLACELDHFKEKQARGETTLHYIKYLTNVKGRFVTLLDRIGLDGAARMEQAIKGYACILDKRQTLFSFYKGPAVERTDEYRSLLPIANAQLFIKDRKRAASFEQYLKERSEDAQSYVSCKDELLRVQNTKFDTVMNALSASSKGLAAKDAVRQKLCEEEAKGPPILPMTREMACVYQYLQQQQQQQQQQEDEGNAVAITLEEAIIALGAVDAIILSARRTQKNCYADLPSEYKDTLDEMRRTDLYLQTIRPNLELSRRHLNYLATHMSRGCPIDYKAYLALEASKQQTTSPTKKRPKNTNK